MDKVVTVLIFDMDDWPPPRMWGAYECVARWERGAWRWKPLRCVDVFPKIVNAMSRGFAKCKIHHFDSLELDFYEMMEWDKLQGADYVP